MNTNKSAPRTPTDREKKNCTLYMFNYNYFLSTPTIKTHKHRKKTEEHSLKPYEPTQNTQKKGKSI